MGVVDIVAVSIVGVSTVGLALLALVSIIGEGYRVVSEHFLLLESNHFSRRSFSRCCVPF